MGGHHQTNHHGAGRPGAEVPQRCYRGSGERPAVNAPVGRGLIIGISPYDAGYWDNIKARYNSTFTKAQMTRAIRDLHIFQKRCDKLLGGNSALRENLVGKENTSVAKKKDESNQLNFMEKYRENIQKVQALGNLAVQQFLG